MLTYSVCGNGAVDSNVLKRSGDSGDPCGTPCVGENVFCESVFSCFVYIVLCVRNEYIILQKCIDVCGNSVCMMP